MCEWDWKYLTITLQNCKKPHNSFVVNSNTLIKYYNFCLFQK